MSKNKIDKGTLKRVLRLVKPYSGFVCLSLVFALISAAAQLLIPVFTGWAIDAMIGVGAVKFEIVLKWIIAVAISAAAGAVAQKLLALTNNKIVYSVCKDLRDELSGKFNKLPLSYLDTHRTGDIVSRAVADADTLADGLLLAFTQLFSGVVLIISILAVMFVLNWVIAIAVLVLTPLSVFAARFITTRCHKYFKAQSEIRGEEAALVNELIEGQRVVREFGHEEESLADFDEINNRLDKAALKAAFFSSLTNPSTRLINNIIYAVITVIGAFFAVAGGGAAGIITVGELSVFLSYASQYAKPFNEISEVITELQNALTCASRVFELIDEKEEIPDCADPLCPPVKGEVKLDKVYFSYVPSRPLIENFCLKVTPGERIAIVGPTGCGKTTLINLLMRFYDVNLGEISVDGADVRRMKRKDLRSRYGMVLQDTWLATGTVKENISYGKIGASDEEVVAAAKAAHAHSFITRLPDGYDTLVTGNGSNLSAGQRQLLCIARAMLSLPDMLILDEATSSIDTRTELKIQSAFNQMMKGRTSFVVAHRLSTIRSADKIIVMNEGHVIEQGSHDELLKKGGFYANLYNAQFAAD